MANERQRWHIEPLADTSTEDAEVKIVEKKQQYHVISSVDPSLTIVAFRTRAAAENYIERRSTNVEQLLTERRGGRTAGSGGKASKQWGNSGHYA